MIGFDNLTAAALAIPGLSTYDQDVRGSARTIADMIKHAMSRLPERPLNHLKTATFVPRGSHGPAPTSPQ